MAVTLELKDERPKGGEWTDLVELFQRHTANASSPDIFKVWGAIMLVAGILERRVWIKNHVGPIYPNLYALLTGTAGVGKSQVISKVAKQWKKTKTHDVLMAVAPDSMTTAALIDTMNSSARALTIDGRLYSYASLAIASSELNTLMPTYDIPFATALIHFWDASDLPYSERRRGNKGIGKEGEQLTIERGQISLLAGVTPAALSELITETAWKSGLMARILVVFSDQEKEVYDGNYFPDPDEEKVGDLEAEKLLDRQCQKLGKLYGPIRVSEDVRKAIRDWTLAGLSPVPAHPRLETYSVRREVLFCKLLTISAVARTGKLFAELPDFDRARKWMIELETAMPKVFTHMAGKNDNSLIQEVLFEVRATGEAISQEELQALLAKKATVERIPKLLEAIDKLGLFTSVYCSDGEVRFKPKEP